MADATTLTDAIEQLYAAPPTEFVRTRSALAADAKAAGDADVAREVGTLRKPTVAAYLVNSFVRHHPQELADLSDLGDRLRAAQSRLDGAAMKELGAARLTLVGRLTDFACEGADPVTPAVREQIADTFTAALADPVAQTALSGGALVVSLRYNGFGEVDLSDALAAPLRVIHGGRSPNPEWSGAQEPGDERRDAQRETARKAATARLTRAQAKLERAEELADSAEKAQERAERQVVEARRTLRSAQDASTAANVAREKARDNVAAASTAQELQFGKPQASRD